MVSFGASYDAYKRLHGRTNRFLSILRNNTPLRFSARDIPKIVRLCTGKPPPKKGLFWGGGCTFKYFFKFWRYEDDSKNAHDQKLVSHRFSIFWSTFRQHLLTNSDFKISNLQKTSKMALFSKKFDFEKYIFHFVDGFAMCKVCLKAFLSLQEHF